MARRVPLAATATAAAAVAAAAAGAGGCYRERPATAPSPARSTPTPAPLPTTFDGFRLGDSFAQVLAREPYRHPCEDYELDDGRARARVYPPYRCEHAGFPASTSVAFITGNPPAAADTAQPIQAFGWVGPYYDDKVPLPVKPGEPTHRAIAALGTPSASFQLGLLHVDQLRGVAVLSARGAIVGFVFGEQPVDPRHDRWVVFDQMYRRHALRPNRRGQSSCLSILRHAAVLRGEDPDVLELRLREQGRLDAELEPCRRTATPAKVRCSLDAQTIDELERCP